MGFLHKLWDETLAGPAPESGLGKLRKYDSMSIPSSPPMAADEVPVTRCITILRTSSSTLGNLSPDSGSPSESPTTPGTPRTPGTPGALNFKKLTRRKSSADALTRAEPRSPTGYDWMVITALDR
ncbi:auxin-repressed 12.5 kDa protein-like [Pyrus ussuriensis x Pyrus communis]|uniref:Auxin-repressed 12.5 kDa protein-like n=1 Tax=Pyrus ussuriensis x Pyrus communis TaxID=2448454 RepID=A0A5N5GJQ4_9ROSA|nr:dormancy-associated protein homolog 4-like isoform X2 [Pyrus x bretschneideri]KAB2610994.1 auxin-repressed 12.5 kDa protein-like [Pyrus ussuriensis x Pyrus communis]